MYVYFVVADRILLLGETKILVPVGFLVMKR
jgi:hypothetical protein